jgi:hypothetical protein
MQQSCKTCGKVLDSAYTLDPEAKVLEPREYDRAIIGATQKGKAIYDKLHVVKIGKQLMDCTEEESWEWHNFNTFDAYMGTWTPLFVEVN